MQIMWLRGSFCARGEQGFSRLSRLSGRENNPNMNIVAYGTFFGRVEIFLFSDDPRRISLVRRVVSWPRLQSISLAGGRPEGARCPHQHNTSAAAPKVFKASRSLISAPAKVAKTAPGDSRGIRASASRAQDTTDRCGGKTRS